MVAFPLCYLLLLVKLVNVFTTWVMPYNACGKRKEGLSIREE